MTPSQQTDAAKAQGLVAIVAGAGALPAVLKAQRPDALVFAPEGLEVAIEAERFHFERLVPFLHQLLDRGVTQVVLAGAMQRPRLDPSLFDAATAQMVPRLLAAMQGGDDATLRTVVSIFEEIGLEVVAAHDVAPDLVPSEGVLSQVQPSDGHVADAERAAQIVAALGAVDVGQGAVVAQGLCLAVESLPGTDAMLAWVGQISAGRKSGGVFYKAPKPQQERRVDLPALGPQTVRNAQSAGLGAIVWEAGGVMLLEREEMIRLADEAGLVLWARRP